MVCLVTVLQAEVVKAPHFLQWHVMVCLIRLLPRRALSLDMLLMRVWNAATYQRAYIYFLHICWWHEPKKWRIASQENIYILWSETLEFSMLSTYTWHMNIMLLVREKKHDWVPSWATYIYIQEKDWRAWREIVNDTTRNIFRNDAMPWEHTRHMTCCCCWRLQQRGQGHMPFPITYMPMKVVVFNRVMSQSRKSHTGFPSLVLFVLPTCWIFLLQSSMPFSFWLHYWLSFFFLFLWDKTTTYLSLSQGVRHAITDIFCHFFIFS